MRTALFLIAMAISDLTPHSNETKKEVMPILGLMLWVFVVMDVIDFFRN